MAADDLPSDALSNLYKLEDASSSGVSRFLVKWLSRIIPLPPPFDRILRFLKELAGEDSSHRVQVMLDTVQAELVRLTRLVETIYESMSQREQEVRAKAVFELLLDAVRKADQTRSEQRARHIGIILARTVIDPEPINADYVEEMMRVAMNLGDEDLRYLRELVSIEGDIVERDGRIDRRNAHDKWVFGFWGDAPSPAIDSAMNKLESYGLVTRIAPPNNFNINADIQNRYALLPKGLRFAQSIEAIH